MKKLVKAVVAGAAGLAPMLAFAAPAAGSPKDFIDIIGILNTIVNTLFPFIIGLAILVILWGIFGYISGAGDEEKRAQAKQYIIWGIIGLFVMISIWGLVNILSRTFNLETTNQPPPSFVPGAVQVCPDGGAPKSYTNGIPQC